MVASEEEDLDAECIARVGSMVCDKWHLDRILGIGGMAAVYAATHRNGSIAALKILHPQYAAQSHVVERFLREAYIANKAGHEGIVEVRDDAVDDRGVPFLVMELLEGVSVADKADANGGRLPMNEALWVGQQLLSVLEAAHAQGIVHRDIKPDNIFWTNQGKIKVLDFGIARLREDAPSKRTRTGTVFGTPGYMAPEQALGRWPDVDARTDLWAVGATIFNLLTGQSVHEGETDNERLVNAATRPARSLGRAMPGAPTLLVQVIDRALDFDPHRRYPDARSMRLDLERAAAEAATDVGADATGRQADIVTGAEQDEAAEVPEVEELLDAMSEGATSVAREFFTLLEKAMKARSQYGKGHKEADRRLETAFTYLANSFTASGEPIAWSIRAYGFTVRDEALWEPKPPLDKVCYRLFSDGIRALAILPGLRLEELTELNRILVADASSEISPEDNTVTLLWDAKFDHVLYEEADSFAEGDQAERAAFEKRRGEVVAAVELDTSDQLEGSWYANAHKGATGERESKQRTLLSAVAGGSAASAAAQASGMRPDQAAPRGDVLAIDPATRAVMAARLAVSSEDVGERFASAAAAAFVMAYRMGEPGLVAAPLRTTVDSLSGDAAEADALAFVFLLAGGVAKFATEAEREAMTGSLVNSLVSPQRFAGLTAAAVAPDAPQELRDRFISVLRRLDGNHVAPVAAAASTMEACDIRKHLLEYVSAHAQGHEGEIGATFASGHLEPSLALLKVLVALGTPAAREAAQAAAKSPHPIVRIEALGLVEGSSGAGIRQALRAMLEDWDPAVRIAALQSIGAYKVKVAGPGLVMRVKSPEFDTLSVEERREALNALYLLTSSRAEAVYLDLLADTRLVPTEPHEQTRALAAEMLGLRGRSSDARTALEGASRARWRNSERVRSAATAALIAMDNRGGRAPVSDPPPPNAAGGEPAVPSRSGRPPMNKR
jgi:serine/threonine protein kinase